ncbi:MAG TPA: hypothetical protein VFB17_01865 [Gaiellaceae bacterium]|nr:hypothetical protein [Gaiellaceae bacterium]
MKRASLLFLLLALVPPGAASAAACSPLNCAPSQFVLAHGSLLAVRGAPDKPLRVIDLRTGRTRWWLPPGIVTGNTLVHQDGPLLTWLDAARGTRVADALLQAYGAFALVGTSQDAKRAVLARTQHRSTTFAIVSPAAERIVKLGGSNWQFDALNGRYLFLIQSLRDGYEVRLYDLATNRLQRQPLKDPNESALIQGVPFARASSPNGRYLFTLYLGSDGSAMIHELDTAAGFAYCVDLPGTGDFNAAATWAIAPSADNGTLWAVSVGYGRLVAIDVAAHAVREHASFRPPVWIANPGVAALAPDGTRLAVTDAQHTWFVSLRKLAVRRGPSHVAIALAFSADGRRVFGVGERSRVFALDALTQ